MRRLAACLLLLAALPASAQSDSLRVDAPQDSIRFAGAFALPYLICDCDPSVLVFRAVRALPGYADADTSGSVIRTVATGELIEGSDWDAALTVVDRPDLAFALDTLTLPVQRFGRIRTTENLEEDGEDVALHLADGDRIEFLIDDFGYGFFRWNGVLYGTPMALLDDERVAWEHAVAQTATWLHLTPKNGRPAAWVLGEVPSRGPGSDEARFNLELVCESPTARADDCYDSDR